MSLPAGRILPGNLPGPMERTGRVMKGRYCSSAPQLNIIPNTAHLRGKLCQEESCWRTALLSLLSGTLLIRSQGSPTKPESRRAIPSEGTVLHRLRWGGIYILRSLQRSKRQPNIYFGSESQRLYFKSANQVRIQQPRAEWSWKEGEPPAPGSAPHSTARSGGAFVAMWPHCPISTTRTGLPGVSKAEPEHRCPEESKEEGENPPTALGCERCSKGCNVWGSPRANVPLVQLGESVGRRWGAWKPFLPSLCRARPELHGRDPG